MPSPEVLSLYNSESFMVRFHVLGRWRLIPYPKLMQYIIPKGLVSDVGCGYGLWSFYLAKSFPDMNILGIDPDQHKIDVARKIVDTNGLENVHFQVGRAQDMTLPSCTTITMVDILYLVPYVDQTTILTHVINQLQTGGRFLLKEMSLQPRWKYIWNWIEEWLAVRLLHITYGQNFYFRDKNEWITLLTELGLKVKTVRLDKGYIHPHILYIGEKYAS